MFLKDQLKDTYQKASLDRNNFILENVIDRWVHRFGVQSLNELIVNNQEQINLIEEDEVKENQEQINMELLESVQYKMDRESKFKEESKLNNEINNKEVNESYKNKSENMEVEELPLPNINNLRKWISNEKRAS